MANWQLFNGEFVKEEVAVLPTSNRGFCYGDGFFESMRVSNGKVPFVAQHWQRILSATDFLRIQLPENFTPESFNQAIVALAAKNGLKNARIRFQGYRDGSGRYFPVNNGLGWSMVCQALESPSYDCNSKGLKVDVCATHHINPAPQSFFKSSNSLPYIMGGIFADENGLDDCFILDSEGFIAEATGSNVFVCKGTQLITPDLSNGGVKGVMRNVVLANAGEAGFTVSEELITLDDVIEADECFLTNASKGLQWIGAIRKKRFYKRVSVRLTEHINRKYGLIS